MTSIAMGPLPAVTGCHCHVCLPHQAGETPHDAEDRLCIETVIRAGWQVVAVGAGEGQPAFAYTIGLAHRSGHPELAVSGLPTGVMHRALDLLAHRVVEHGDVVRPGDVVETVLPNVAVTVDRVSEHGLCTVGLGSWSSWFHRRPVDVLQVVWPTTGGIFAWQPGAPAQLDELQPRSWRVESPRVGALAPDPLWPFAAPPDAMAAVCAHVREENAPIRFAAHTTGDRGEPWWDFHCGADHGLGIGQLRSEHLAHTVRAAPSLRQVAGLRPGQFAERVDAFSPWRRGRLTTSIIV